MLSVTGIPYDTLRGVIGMTGDANGSLKEFGIHYKEVQLKADGTPDYQAIEQAIEPNQKMVYICLLYTSQQHPSPQTETVPESFFDINVIAGQTISFVIFLIVYHNHHLIFFVPEEPFESVRVLKLDKMCIRDRKEEEEQESIKEEMPEIE